MPRSQPPSLRSGRSLSVDETNALRAKLGLKPLRISQAPAEAPAPPAAPAGDAKEQSGGLAARLAAAKAKRSAPAAQEDVIGKAASGSASDWVAHMKAKRAARKATGKAAPARRSGPMALLGDGEEEEQVEGAGLSVRHAVGDFAEGQDVVLTLADRSVLDEEGEDVLENSRLMADAKARLAVSRKAKVAAMRGATGYSRLASREAGGSAPGLLQQYDDGDEEAMLAGKAVLTASGALVSRAGLEGGDDAVDSAAGDAVRQRLQAAAGGGTAAAEAGGVVVASDFMTREEAAALMPQAGKASKKAKKAKKASKRRKRQREEGGGSPPSAVDGAVEAEAAARFGTSEGRLGQGTSAGARLAAELSGSGGQDGGGHVDAAGEAAAAAVRARLAAAEGEEVGGDGAQHLTKARKYTLRDTPGGAMSGLGDGDAEEDGGEAAWAAQLAAGLARARAAQAAAPPKPTASEEAGDVEASAVLAKVKAARAARAAAAAASAGATSGGSGPGTLTFSSSAEFTRRLAAKTAGPAVPSRDGGGSAGSAPSAAVASGGGEAAAKDEEGSLDRQLAAAKADVAKATVDGEMVTEAGETSSSTAAALSFLRRTGALSKANAGVLVAGRANDRRPVLPGGEEDPAPRVHLRQQDAFGRELTQKEAWRQLNYAFHGFGSGKRKQERKLKRLMEDIGSSGNGKGRK